MAKFKENMTISKVGDRRVTFVKSEAIMRVWHDWWVAVGRPNEIKVEVTV